MKDKTRYTEHQNFLDTSNFAMSYWRNLGHDFEIVLLFYQRSVTEFTNIKNLIFLEPKEDRKLAE